MSAILTYFSTLPQEVKVLFAPSLTLVVSELGCVGLPLLHSCVTFASTHYTLPVLFAVSKPQNRSILIIRLFVVLPKSPLVKITLHFNNIWVNCGEITVHCFNNLFAKHIHDQLL